MIPVLLLLAAEALTPAWGGQITRGDARNPVVLPPQKVTLPFDHAVHLGKAGLECTDCHDKAKTSEKSKDYLIPSRTGCFDCHDAKEVTGDWGPDPKAPGNAVAIPAPNLVFPHSRHLELAGVTCLTCHEGVDKTKVATRDNLPPMEKCLTCHDGAKAPNACTTCHPRGRGETIRTAFAEGVLKPDDHGPLWLKQHEAVARRDMGLCASCHAQEDCLSCHDGSIPPTFHDNDYVRIHRTDAIANNPPCASCHRVEKFCRDCHFRAQVTDGPVLYPSFNGTFHPPGWNDFPPSGPQHHSYVAKKNIASCAGCHQAQDCLGCHQYFIGAAQTHPPGWAHSTTMRRLRRASTASCLLCHNPADPTDPYNTP